MLTALLKHVLIDCVHRKCTHTVYQIQYKTVGKCCLMYSAWKSLKIHVQVTCILLRGLNSVLSLFSSLWVLACFSVKVWNPIIKSWLLFLITFQRPLTRILWAPKETQAIVLKPLVLIVYFFVQIWLYVQLQKWLRILHAEFSMPHFELNPWTVDWAGDLEY